MSDGHKVLWIKEQFISTKALVDESGPRDHSKWTVTAHALSADDHKQPGSSLLVNLAARVARVGHISRPV